MPASSQFAAETQSNEILPPAYTEAGVDALFDTPLSTAPESNGRLPVPICPPQVTRGYDSPFARGYKPQFAISGIEQEDWLKFLDSLNIAMVRQILLA